MIIGIIIGATSTLIIGVFTYWIFSFIPRRRQPKLVYLFRRSNKRTASLGDLYRSRPTKVSPELQKKLLDMLDGDTDAAEKLVSRARFGNYNKSEAWYWWKAIQDLQEKRRQQRNE